MKYFGILSFLLGIFICFACGGCFATKTIVKAAIINKSQHDLDWVRVEWKGPYFSGGVMSKDKFVMYMDLVWPYATDGTLTFVDDTTRTRYRIPVSFAAINERIRSGSVRAVTVRILDYDRAAVEGAPDMSYPK
jgi:hypothetical protein